jgi:hypothetical protein
MKGTAAGAVAAAALVAVGTAAAVAITGTNGPDVLAGTLGRDRVSARGGNDRVAVQQGGRDRVSCGRGRDVVTASRNDRVAANCEVVSRQLSRDLRRDPFAQHETQVEPDSFSFGGTTVAVFQSGRYADGGSTMIGFATSRNGGRTWRSGFLPGLTRHSPRPRAAARVSDPSVAFDAVHGVWLAVSLVFDQSFTELAVNRSGDGVHWGAPLSAARAEGGDLAYDKEWIACDNWPASRWRGRCYLSYTDLRSHRIVTRFSVDGGRTWSAAVGSPAEPRREAVGALPVVRPDGMLVVVFLDYPSIVYTRSANGGRSFTPGRPLASAVAKDISRMRESPLPSADVVADGRVYVTWHACDDSGDCRMDDVVMSVSASGTSWSKPVHLPAIGRTRRDSFAPAIAADPAAGGGLAVLYYSIGPSSSIQAWLLRSDDGGTTWAAPVRLTSQGVRRSWIAETGAGAFLGDYFSVSFTSGTPLPVFSDATRPVRGRLRQAIFATTRGL